ncbi:MAG: cation transporter [Lachnospiraceae bacterium]|nr:cation transporter [Lachnospiraceae bacterium]
MDNNRLFETMKPGRALATMAIPTIASQVIILVYNLADTWFIGRTNDPYMIAASSLALSVYLAAVALANVFGVGGGSLMIRLAGQKRTEEAGKVSSYSITAAAISSIVFSILVLIFMTPLLKALGASDNTLEYGKQYLMATSVAGALPTVLSMCIPQILRNAGYAKQAGTGVGLGSIMNIVLDPLFMFVIFPKGYEVLAAGIAMMLSNVISLIYFIVVYRKVSAESILEFPKRLEHIGRDNLKTLFSVGIPAAVAIFFFDLVTIVINRLTAAYGDVALAAMGIVLKIERIPINIGLGICLGMVPLVAFSYGAGNKKRMDQVAKLAAIVIVGFACFCTALFFIFSGQIVGVFIDNEETIALGARFLRGRCFALPFMLAGYFVVNWMNAVGKGKISFLLAIIRHLVLIIPILLIFNLLFGLNGLIRAQLVADVLNAAISTGIFISIRRSFRE